MVHHESAVNVIEENPFLFDTYSGRITFGKIWDGKYGNPKLENICTPNNSIYYE